MRYRALVLSGKKQVSVTMLEAEKLLPGQVRVRLAAGGICGSDLHYYRDFGNVGFSLRDAVVMGHEAAGIIEEIAPDVECLAPGDKVAVNPMMNCGDCLHCRQGRINLCGRKRFPCSAAVYPHVDGFFREFFVVDVRQCVKVPAGADLCNVAFAEPLACSLHAVSRLGNLVGQTVLVTGAGPIGLLAASVAKIGGADRVIVTDIVDEPLAMAKEICADETVNTLSADLEEEVRRIGPVDAAVEASGAPGATVDCLRALCRGGRMVQLGTSPGDDIPVPWVMFQSKEIDVFGSSQFRAEFDAAVDLLLRGRIATQRMLSRQFSLEEADEAFVASGNRRVCLKVQFIP